MVWMFFFFFKQKTAYEMRISDWSSDVCSSDRIDNFTELPEALAPHREALADATVVSFCTGGIRCEKAALWLRADGMDNVLQLDGGILGYFEQVGGQGYDGRCFVFDDRIALDPALAPLVDGVARAA